MEKTNLTRSTKPKRNRNDRLIGFRLDPADYAMLSAKLERNAIGISAYMRNLVRSDTSRLGNAGSAKS